MPVIANDQLQFNFTHTTLPVINKNVFRLGIAGNMGIQSDSIRWAADQGVNYWLWGTGFSKVTDGIKDVIHKKREKHVVAMLGWGFFGWQIRRSVEKALTELNTDYLDCFKLGWLGKTSAYTRSTIRTLLELKKEGKIKSIGCSIHDRPRAARLATNSELELFMIRYSAKHPGAEADVFPYFKQRNPAVISYTTLAWGQLIKSVKSIQIRPFPGGDESVPPLTPALCYRFALSNPNIHVVLSGPQNQTQLEENLKAIHQGVLTHDELKWIYEYGELIHRKKKIDYI